MKRFLGIDPGTTRIGYGVIESDGSSLRPLAWGILDIEGPSPSDKRAVAAALVRLIGKYRPAAAGIERLFFSNNQRTAMSVAEMRGVLMLTLQQSSVPTFEYTPQQVKLAVCGHGSASKRQVQDMVRMLLAIRVPVEPDDAADGLALAMCCLTAKPY